MKVIAIEEHFVSPDVRSAWAAAAMASQEPGESLHTAEMKERLEELSGERLARMDESGVEVQVLSLTSPGLHNLAPAEGVSLARRANDLIAATISRHPDRFDGFATLPITAPQEAARELERSVRELGLKGGMLFGRVMEKNLDHPEFLPVFEAAADLRIPLYLHPQVPPRPVRDAYYSGFDPLVASPLQPSHSDGTTIAASSFFGSLSRASSIAFRSCRSFWGTGVRSCSFTPSV